MFLDGVHVIHQLTQAGRTLVAVLLNCKSDSLQHLIPSGLDALRSCIGLLRRFSGRYICGLRSGDLMEEFCRCEFSVAPRSTHLYSYSTVTQIPLEATPQQDNVQSDRRPPWIRPVRKKAPSIARSNCSGESPSPEAFSPSDFLDAQKAAGPSSSFPSAPQSTGTPVTKFEQPSFADGSGNMNMDIIGNEQLYMSPSDVMSLFNDGSVDLGQIFSPEFIQPPSSADGNNIGGGGEPYLKMTGIVTSP